MTAPAVWPVALGFLLVLGLCVGSFVNVVAYRLPRDGSLWSPPSACPACAAPVRPWHNVPVLGWLILRGRCADCGVRISARYPVVEALTGILFVVTAIRLEQLRLLSALPAYLWLVGAGLALALIDLDVRRLPDAIVLPSYPVVGVLLAASAVARHDPWALARAAIGAAGLFAFFYAIALLQPAAMGFGDVKLAGVLGALLAYLSWGGLIVGAFAGFVLGATYGVVLMATGRGGRRTAIPFGPFMLAGAWLALFVADPIARWYTTFQLPL